MNRFVSAALAGAVAISAVGVSMTSAGADPWHHHHRYYDRGSDVGPALVGGAILGLAVGSMLQPEPVYPAPVYVAPAPVYVEPAPVYAEPPPPPVYAYDSDAHFQWCASTYSSYNGETDTWTDYRGVPHRCIGP